MVAGESTRPLEGFSELETEAAGLMEGLAEAEAAELTGGLTEAKTARRRAPLRVSLDLGTADRYMYLSYAAPELAGHPSLYGFREPA